MTDCGTSVGLITALFLGPLTFAVAGALVYWITAWQDRRDAANYER